VRVPAWLGAGLAVSAIACASGELRVPTVDSGVWGRVVDLDGVQWVDDDRVLFLGGTGERFSGSDLRLKLFQVSSGSTEEIDRGVHSFCYVDGRLLIVSKHFEQRIR
jgi:hypothetical protein